MQALTSGDVRLTTVNGSVSAGLPLKINAHIDAETVNGRVQTDFPVKITGKFSTRHLHGTIGNGGPTLMLKTVNGSIMVHERTRIPTPIRIPSASGALRAAAAALAYPTAGAALDRRRGAPPAVRPML